MYVHTYETTSTVKIRDIPTTPNRPVSSPPATSPGHTGLLPGTAASTFSGWGASGLHSKSPLPLRLASLTQRDCLKSTQAVHTSLVFLSVDSAGHVLWLIHCLLPQGIARFWLLQVEPL